MAALGLKIAGALAMVSAVISLCHAASASGYCPARTCRLVFNAGVEIRFPFVLQDDVMGGRCGYTDYPEFEFTCSDEVLLLNFTENNLLSRDEYEVVGIDYWNQSLQLEPYVSEATCRPFDANRFGGLKITNTSTLLLDCPNQIPNSQCQKISGATFSNTCNNTGSGVLDPSGDRWLCSMNLRNFADKNFSSCHLIDGPLPVGLNMTGSSALVLQFEGNKTLSFLELPSSPTPAPAPNGVDSQASGKSNGFRRRLGTGPPKEMIILAVVAPCGLVLVNIICHKMCGSNSNMTAQYFTQLNINKMKENKTQGTTLYTLKELERATKNFSNDFKLGSGGFGIVYKGTLDNGTEVAIKKTNQIDGKGSEQYVNEVLLLSQVNHRNLVQLHGCCFEVEVPLLVYEYVSNGDLFQHLQGKRQRMPLPWAKRLQIAIDTAEALRYLHSVANQPIYHRDVKTSNILLDDEFNVKVADFGISRLLKVDATHISTSVQGTPGYLDPEYFQTFHLTDKSDVYGFGMVLLELVTSLKPIDLKRREEDVNLKSMAIPFIRMGNLKAIVDTRLFNEDPSESCRILAEMQQVAKLASKCLANRRHKRPSMKEVLSELVSIKGIDMYSRNVGEICSMDHEEEEMSLVVESQSLNVTSSTEILVLEI